MKPAEAAAHLREEAKRYDAAAQQQHKMAEWSGQLAPGALSRQRARLFRDAAAMLEELEEYKRQYGGLAPRKVRV